jgi:hypothetical protein
VDILVAIRLITHLDDWENVLREMCRVARKAVVIDFPTNRSLNGLSPLTFDLKNHIEGNTRPYSSFSVREFRSIFEGAGFEIDIIARQFFLPMFIHRAVKGHSFAQGTEKLMRQIGITSLLGCPAVLRAKKVASEQAIAQ